MGAVHDQQAPQVMADPCNPGNIRHAPQVIRAGQVNRRRPFRSGTQNPLHLPGGHVPGKVGFPLFRHQPKDIQIQQGCRAEEGFVHIPGRGNQGLFPPAFPIEHGQIQHGPDALGGTLGGIEGIAAKEPARVFLAAADNALRLIQAVRSVNLRNVQRLHPQSGNPLMSGHMQPQGLPPVVIPDEITDGRLHYCSPRARATATMMAHSIRLRKSLQPYSYTPVTLPVEW